MKIAHLADLHLGKTLHGYSLIEDQRYICREITEKIRDHQIDTVIIAGDVYDRAVPSAEATVLLNDFLNDLSDLNVNVLMIAGNHDSADRLSYGASLFKKMKIYIAGSYTGKLEPVVLEDDYGEICFYLLPFIRPLHVNRYLGEEEKTGSYTEAVDYVLKHAGIDETKRNVLVMHQFVTGAKVDENGSEELIVGGLDQVSVDVLKGFDYTALGHIHRPQTILNETIRYSGTPLKYSLGEIGQTKSFPVIELKEKGVVDIQTVELKPLHEMRQVKGTFRKITKNHEQVSLDYVHVILTDENEITDAGRILRNIYPNILRLEYDNQRTRTVREVSAPVDTVQKTPLQIFAEFYEKRNGVTMSEDQQTLLQQIIEDIWAKEGGQ